MKKKNNQILLLEIMEKDLEKHRKIINEFDKKFRSENKGVDKNEK